MTKLNQPNVIPPSIPIQHNSGSIRTTPAGGKVSPDQYVGKTPASTPAPTTTTTK
jgi:hypothetical protein